MAKLRLTVKMDNDAFEDSTEITRILHKVSDQIKGGRDDAPILDINGNTVGDWSITR